MASNDVRFKHIGVSSDGTVVFCEMDNGKTYAMPLRALERAENWNPKAKPTGTGILHDGCAAFVRFDDSVTIDFPADFVLHVCEPSYAHYKDKGRAASGVGGRIREIREARGLTLDALAAKSGIAKPNLSRLENDKVTPTIATLRTIAAALHTHPALLLSTKKPEHAWTWTHHTFVEWKLGLLWNEGAPEAPVPVSVAEMLKVFLATRPEHRYARQRLQKYANPNDSEFAGYSLDGAKWSREVALAEAAERRANGARRK
jgi:transcriptional regulator with XRE-family HTH domain